MRIYNMETSIQQYKQAVSVIKEAILHSQYRAAKLVTGEELSLNFGIGAYVSHRSRQEKWGTSIIESISEQLRRELPGLRGFSARSIRNMRTFYEYWKQYFNLAAIGCQIATIYKSRHYRYKMLLSLKMLAHGERNQS